MPGSERKLILEQDSHEKWYLTGDLGFVNSASGVKDWSEKYTERKIYTK